MPLVRDFVDDCMLGWSMWNKRWAALQKFNPQLSKITHMLTECVDVAKIKAEYKVLRSAEEEE